MDVNIAMHVDASPNSLKDACMVELKMPLVGMRNIYDA